MRLNPLASSSKRTALAAISAAFLAIAGLSVTGCTTTNQNTQARKNTTRIELDTAADGTLQKLYQNSADARDLVARARGVLVFPSVMKAGFVFGGEYGRGVLRVNGRTAGYYKTTGGSIGWQIGAQSSATVLLFMTEEALRRFLNSSGWTIGVDATVAIASMGANGSVDSNTIRQPVIGFVLNNAGLMAGLSLEGNKIYKDGSL